jgi:hypothetical protein
MTFSYPKAMNPVQNLTCWICGFHRDGYEAFYPLVSYLAYFFTLKLEGICSFGMSFIRHHGVIAHQKMEIITLSLYPSLNMRDQVSQTYKSVGKIYSIAW